MFCNWSFGVIDEVCYKAVIKAWHGNEQDTWTYKEENKSLNLSMKKTPASLSCDQMYTMLDYFSTAESDWTQTGGQQVRIRWTP